MLEVNGFPFGVDATAGQLSGNTGQIAQGDAGCIQLWNTLIADAPSVSDSNDGSD